MMEVLSKEVDTQEKIVLYNSKNIDGYNYGIGPCRFCLRLIGVWPDPYRKDKWTSIARITIMISVMFLFGTASQTVKIILSWKDLNVVMEILSNCDIPISLAVMKLTSLWYHKRAFRNLIREIIIDWKTSHSEEELSLMWKNAKMSRFFCIGCSVFLSETIFLLQCVFGLVKPISYALNPTINDTLERPLYMDGSFPYNTQISPNYELTIGGQILANFFGSITFSTTDSFFVLLMLHLIGQLSVLKLALIELPNKINNTSDKNSFYNTFSFIHMKYNNLRRFSMVIEESFRNMFLLQMIPSMFGMCTQGYQLIMILDEENIPFFELMFMIYFLVLFLFTIFIYCYVAELLQQESLGISHAAYNCDWHILPPKEAKLLILVINRTQYPFEITAGKFVVFSLELYCQILKSSAGYLSMLLAVKNKYIKT